MRGKRTTHNTIIRKVRYLKRKTLHAQHRGRIRVRGVISSLQGVSDGTTRVLGTMLLIRKDKARKKVYYPKRTLKYHANIYFTFAHHIYI